jgi:hypothetical protein
VRRHPDRRCDLGDRAAVDALFEGGVDGVLHPGGISPEKPTDPDVIYQSGHFATSKHPDDE